MNQSVPEHVDGGLALLQYDVPHQGFVLAIFGFHVYEDNLAEDGAEPFNLDLDRPANGALE